MSNQMHRRPNLVAIGDLTFDGERLKNALLILCDDASQAKKALQTGSIEFDVLRRDEDQPGETNNPQASLFD